MSYSYILISSSYDLRRIGFLIMTWINWSQKNRESKIPDQTKRASGYADDEAA